MCGRVYVCEGQCWCICPLYVWQWVSVAVSSCCAPGTDFQRLIPDNGPVAQNPAGVKRIVFCTGKVYYELTKERKAHGMEDTVAIARMEQVATHTLNTSGLPHRAVCTRKMLSQTFA